tara:strand:- start:447 stop:611 length:165 start_codon:yes stop_codon:yes gene_type:complete
MCNYPGIGLALMVMAFFLLMQAMLATICLLAQRSGWHSPLSARENKLLQLRLWR